jgi:hypothetical protein
MLWMLRMLWMLWMPWMPWMLSMLSMLSCRLRTLSFLFVSFSFLNACRVGCGSSVKCLSCLHACHASMPVVWAVVIDKMSVMPRCLPAPAKCSLTSATSPQTTPGQAPLWPVRCW